MSLWAWLLAMPLIRRHGLPTLSLGTIIEAGRASWRRSEALTPYERNIEAANAMLRLRETLDDEIKPGIDRIVGEVWEELYYISDRKNDQAKGDE